PAGPAQLLPPRWRRGRLVRTPEDRFFARPRGVAFRGCARALAASAVLGPWQLRGRWTSSVQWREPRMIAESCYPLSRGMIPRTTIRWRLVWPIFPIRLTELRLRSPCALDG